MLTRILLPALHARQINAELHRENAALRETIRTLELQLATKTEALHRMTVTLNEIAANEAAEADRCESATVIPFVGRRR